MPKIKINTINGGYICRDTANGTLQQFSFTHNLVHVLLTQYPSWNHPNRLKKSVKAKWLKKYIYYSQHIHSYGTTSSSSICMQGYFRLQLIFLGSHNLVHQLAFFQEKEGWHSFNLPLFWNRLKNQRDCKIKLGNSS